MRNIARKALLSVVLSVVCFGVAIALLHNQPANSYLNQCQGLCFLDSVGAIKRLQPE